MWIHTFTKVLALCEMQTDLSGILTQITVPHPTTRSNTIKAPYTRTHTHAHTHTHTYIYRWCLLLDSRLFCTGIENCRKLLRIQYVIAIHLMRWLTNFYDFTFKWTATAVTGMHPTKAWLSLLVNFKNAIWTWGHFRRKICNKILF